MHDAVRVTGRAELAAVFAGGFLGALSRTGVAQALPQDAGEWPWATLTVNLFGTLLLGFVAARVPAAQSRLLALLGPGFCGALTTFATVQVELLRMLDGNGGMLAAVYAAVSLAGGLAAAATGIRLGRRAA